MQLTHRAGLCVVKMSEELLARLFRPSHDACSSRHTHPRIELSIAKVHYNDNAYGIEVHTDTLTVSHTHYRVLTFAVFTRRRFDLSPHSHGPLLLVGP